ncbi:MAG: hypothetical protein F9K32_00815 [Desulfobulbaceae bacterium]|nr:MAG: hypothetical protein F9K32_00815 [Desulfobulbaceae bacterium]
MCRNIPTRGYVAENMGRTVTTISDLIDSGQGLWLEGLAGEHATLSLLADNRQGHSIAGLSVTLDACDRVLQAGKVFDQLIQEKLREGFYGGRLAMELLIADALHAANLMLPNFQKSGGLNGWVAVPYSPLSTNDTANMPETVPLDDARYRQPNLMISIAGLPSRLPTIESLITLNISLNIGLLFSSLQLRAVAETILQAFEGCLIAGRKPSSSCFLTIPVNRLLAGFSHLFPEKSAVACVNAVLLEICLVARDLFETRRWQRVMEFGAQRPRLVCSFAGSIELCRSNLSLVREIGAVCSVAARCQDSGSSVPDRIPTVPDGKAGHRDQQQQSASGSICAGIDIEMLANSLQKDEDDALLRSWISLLDTIARKSAALTAVCHV